MKQIDIIVLGSIVGICVLGAAVGGGGYLLYGRSNGNQTITKKHEESPQIYEDGREYIIRVNDNLTHICVFRNNKFYRIATFNFKKNRCKGYTNGSDIIYETQTTDHVKLISNDGNPKLDEYVALQNQDETPYLCKVVSETPYEKFLKMYQINNVNGTFSKCDPHAEFIFQPGYKDHRLGEMIVPNSGGKRKTRHRRRR